MTVTGYLYQVFILLSLDAWSPRYIVHTKYASDMPRSIKPLILVKIARFPDFRLLCVLNAHSKYLVPRRKNVIWYDWNISCQKYYYCIKNWLRHWISLSSTSSRKRLLMQTRSKDLYFQLIYIDNLFNLPWNYFSFEFLKQN